jgi:transcriptional regulator with XRE-family HTH domain
MTKNEKLKQSRLKKKLTQAELAAILNVKQAYISGIETSQTFGIKKAREIAKVLDVDAEWLYNDDIEPEEGGVLTGSEDRNTPNFNPRANENTTDSYKKQGRGFRDHEPVEFYGSPPASTEDRTTQNTDILKWVDPHHTPIPVFDLAENFDSISQLIEYGKPTVLLLKGHLDCDAVVRHVDSAMNKDWPERCQLGIRRIRNFKKRIIWGAAHRIVLDEQIVTRYVFKGDSPNELLLKSSDPVKFPDMNIGMDEIKEMWKVESLSPIPDIILF